MAFSLTKVASTIWRNYVSDGVPASGKQKPSKADIRVWGGEIEDMLEELYTLAGGAISGSFILDGVATPTQITSDQNDYSPTSWSSKTVFRVSSDATRKITGLASLTDNSIRVLINVGSFNIFLPPEHTSSSAANRLSMTKPIVLRPYQPVTFRYDGDLDRWVVMFAPHPTNPVAGSYTNLVVTVTSDTAVTLTADYITLPNSYGEVVRKDAVSLSLAITTSGANGLDTGAEASSTWYYVWAIYNPMTDTLAGLLSTSSSSPTLPSGYTFYARYGAVRNDGSSNLLRTLQKGRRAQYIVGTNPTATLRMANGSSGSISVPTWTAIAVGAYVPPTASVIIGSCQCISSGGNNGIICAPNNSYGALSSTTNPPPVMGHTDSNTGAGAASSSPFQFMLESTNIYYASDFAGSAISCLGWEDNL